jgi:hypothetical protein
MDVINIYYIIRLKNHEGSGLLEMLYLMMNINVMVVIITGHVKFNASAKKFFIAQKNVVTKMSITTNLNVQN